MLHHPDARFVSHDIVACTADEDSAQLFVGLSVCVAYLLGSERAGFVLIVFVCFCLFLFCLFRAACGVVLCPGGWSVGRLLFIEWLCVSFLLLIYGCR